MPFCMALGSPPPCAPPQGWLLEGRLVPTWAPCLGCSGGPRSGGLARSRPGAPPGQFLTGSSTLGIIPRFWAASCLPEPQELPPKASKEAIPTNTVQEMPMLGWEPAPTRTTSLPSSSPREPCSPQRDAGAGRPPMGLQQIPAACKGLETPSEPHRGGSPCPLLLQRLRRRETRKAEVGKPSFHSVTPSPWTRGNDNDHNFRKDLMLSIALRYCL